jgi:nitrite reductase (NADH) small subunit
MTWIRITPAADIPAREGRVVNVNGQDLAVFNLGDRYVAIDNRCPHQGGRWPTASSAEPP